MNFFTPPTKRTTGQCTCPQHWRDSSVYHLPDCPALYPLQPQPGDEPDALTRLTRLVRSEFPDAQDVERAIALISEAADERRALEIALAMHTTTISAQQETITALSNKATKCVRMGQQQGRVELAEEIAGMLTTVGPTHTAALLRRIIDGEQ